VLLRLRQGIRIQIAALVCCRTCRHEKYDVTGIGSTGSGGEYTPQVGFGWTNGVALDLITRYNFTTLDF